MSGFNMNGCPLDAFLVLIGEERIGGSVIIREDTDVYKRQQCVFFRVAGERSALYLSGRRETCAEKQAIAAKY